MHRIQSITSCICHKLFMTIFFSFKFLTFARNDRVACAKDQKRKYIIHSIKMSKSLSGLLFNCKSIWDLQFIHFSALIAFNFIQIAYNCFHCKPHFIQLRNSNSLQRNKSSILLWWWQHLNEAFSMFSGWNLCLKHNLVCVIFIDFFVWET